MNIVCLELAPLDRVEILAFFVFHPVFMNSQDIFHGLHLVLTFPTFFPL